MSQSKRQLARKYVRFSLSTLVGTAVDMFVLWVCSHLIFRGWYIGETIVSPTISFEFAVMANFIVASLFVWRDRVQWRPFSSLAKTFLKYNTSCIAGFLFKLAILVAAQLAFHWDVLLCNLFALCFSGIFNFVMNEWFVYRKKQ